MELIWSTNEKVLRYKAFNDFDIGESNNDKSIIFS